MARSKWEAPSSEGVEFTLIKDDTFKALKKLDTKFDMVFVDPPYFL